MAVVRLAAASAAMFAAMIAASHAGPCAADIDAMQARIDAKVEAVAAAGPFLRQTDFAGRSDQPTPRSIAAAEARRGEISWQTVDAVRRDMAQARAADAAGDGRACRIALAEVRHMIDR
jgi:hypothetical protein